MKRIMILSLMAIACLSVQAQEQKVKVLASSPGVFVPRPEVNTDKKTKKTSAVWHSTNNDWIKDNCEAKNVTIVKDYQQLFPEIANMPLDDQPYMPMSWRLTAEGGETVMHCYFRMPADEVTHLWLTSEETCLVDGETGVQYRIRRTEPDTFRKHFSIKAKKGDVVDLKIFFPPLPESTKDVIIFGIPNWYLVGDKVSLQQQHNNGWAGVGFDYDVKPQFHQPRLLQAHLSEDKPYDKQNWNTWKVLTDAHLIKPQKDGTMAIWLTPEATYLAVACEQNWTREYWGFSWGNDKADVLLDDAGRQYKLREVQGVPQNELFFLEGNAGDYIAYLKVFDPIPLDVKTFTFISPEGEPFNAWGASWKGSVLHNLSIEELRNNQRLFEYQPRKVVE
jgi:hypothetical protein